MGHGYMLWLSEKRVFTGSQSINQLEQYILKHATNKAQVPQNQIRSTMEEDVEPQIQVNALTRLQASRHLQPFQRLPHGSLQA